MANITKQLALSIVNKLGAEMDERPKRPHDVAKVYEGGKLVATFGIRRGSKRNAGHDHIPGKLYLSPHNTKLLGQCPYSRKEWIDHLIEKGLVDKPKDKSPKK